MTTHEQFADQLALHALGSLEGSELDALIAHLDECVECRRELQELRGDMALLALSIPEVSPPASSRARLLGAIAQEPRGAAIASRTRRWNLIPVLAALALAAISATLWQRNTALQRELAARQAQAQQSESQLEQARQIVSVLTAPDATRITLVAKPKREPEGKAIYLARTGGLVFVASNFAPVPPGKAYELWLLPSNGAAPVPAGVFKPDARGSATVLLPPLPKNLEAKAFAITIEPEAGSSTPTMPIILSGGS